MRDKELLEMSGVQDYRLHDRVNQDEKTLETSRRQEAAIQGQSYEYAIEKDQNLIDSGENRARESTVPEASGKVETAAGRVESVQWTGRKKEKSALSLLCDDFLYKFGHMSSDGSPSYFQLHTAAAHCGVPRRRMYDVINVLEAIGVVKRTAKLRYLFYGYDKLPDVLTGIVEKEDTDSNDKSVGHLTRKMIRVLLQHNGMMPTGELSAKLIGPNVAPQPVKKQRSQKQITVERRIYDIASILSSVGLLERVLQEKRIPTIMWVYGWVPGSNRQPPILSVAKMALEPAPTLEPLTDEQIWQSQGKRKAVDTLEKTAQSPKNTVPAHFQGGNYMTGNFMDEDAFSKMVATTPMLQSFSRTPPGFLPGMDSNDPLAGLDPSALAALLAAQQNMPTTGQQLSPGMMPGEIPQEIMMQFQKYGLLYPYMMQCQPMQQGSGSALSPASNMNHDDNKM